jgi:hypothetical protein
MSHGVSACFCLSLLLAAAAAAAVAVMPQVVASMSPADVVSEYATLVTTVKQGLMQMQHPDVHPDVLK